MIAVLAALKWELKPLEGRVEKTLLLRTGMGRANVKKAFKKLFRGTETAPKPEAVLSVGFCGALCPRLREGELILAEEVMAVGEKIRFTTDGWELEQAEGALSRQGLPYHRGRLLTVEHVVAEPEEKQRFARNFSALACEMEGYWIAEEASSHGIPFLILRAVLDRADEELPFDGSLFGARGLFKLPVKFREALRWWRRTQRVGEELGRGAEALIQGWEGP